MANMADHILQLLKTVTGEIPNEIPEVKSLRWLANMWPLVEKPQDEADRMSTCIHLYCTAAADRMVQMSEAVDFARTINSENVRLKAELEKVNAERDAAVADLKASTNSSCVLCKWFDGNNHCTAEEPCGPNDNWEWRGADHVQG